MKYRVSQWTEQKTKNILKLISTNNEAECTHRTWENSAPRQVIVAALMNPEGSNF